MRSLLSLVGCAVLLGVAVTSTFADERADWGKVVATNVEESTLLLENAQGYQLVAIDPWAEIRGAGQTPMTLSDIRPGDRMDYEVATWAGMSISEFAYVTPAVRAEGSDLIAAAKASE
jgi:hypothetical protein